MNLALATARRILVCLGWGIGDVVMQTPVLEALRSAAPSSHITTLGAYPAGQLLDRDPRVDAVACVQDWGLQHWGDLGMDRAREEIGSWLRQKNFDLALGISNAASAFQHVLWEEVDQLFDSDRRAEWAVLRHKSSAAQAIRASVWVGD